jgi:phosphoserine phosphatase RsbU/P
MALVHVDRVGIRHFFQRQQLYVFVGVALFAVFSAMHEDTRLWSVLVFSLCIGNLTFPIMTRLQRYYAHRAFPFNWLVYMPLLALAGFGSTAVAVGIVYWVFLTPSTRAETNTSGDLRIGTLITMIVGAVVYFYGNMKDRLETHNVRLQQAVRTGEARLEQHEKELEIAREIQAGLIPSQIPQLDDLQIAASWQPARAVGGDYFDVIKLDEQRMAICIADVVGKGIAAALLMANVQAAVKAFAGENTSPSEICERLNRVLCSNLAPGKFVTFFCCVIDTEARTLSYCNAGHCYPLLSRAKGKAEVCGEGGIVLGVFPDSKYENVMIRFEPGDKMLLFTDGITEATNQSGEEYGEVRLRQRLEENLDTKILTLHSKLMQEVSEFCERDFADDATLVLVSFVPARDVVSQQQFRKTLRMH